MSKQCQHQQTYVDNSRLICAQCGEILQENYEKVQQEFNKITGRAMGQNLNLDKHIGIESLSYQNRLSNLNQYLSRYADKLYLSEEIMNNAKNNFQKLFEYGTKAYKLEFESAALMYIACRQNNLPYMLLDFADVFKSNISLLFRTFQEICTELHLQFPDQEAKIFVVRYIEKLFSIQCIKNYWKQYLFKETKQDKIKAEEMIPIYQNEIQQFAIKISQLFQPTNLYQYYKVNTRAAVFTYIAINQYLPIDFKSLGLISFNSEQLLKKCYDDIISGCKELQEYNSDTIMHIEQLSDKIVIKRAIDQEIIQKREKRLKKYESVHDNQYSTQPQKFENKLIYQYIPKIVDIPNDILCDKEQKQQRAQIFDKIYKENLEYLLKRRQEKESKVIKETQIIQNQQYQKPYQQLQGDPSDNIISQLLETIKK